MMQGHEAAVIAQDILPIFGTAWLACLGIPLGALALILGCRIADGETVAPLMGPAAMATPVFWLLAAPMAFAIVQGFVDWSVAASSFCLMAGWSVLTWLTSRPSGGSALEGWVIACLFAHLVMVTVAVSIWMMPFGPPLAASAFGVIVAVSQACGAAAFGVLFVQRLRGVLLGLLAVWAGLSFVQALVLWSANDPADVVWFQAHEAGAGAMVLVIGVASGAIALGVLSVSAWRTASILGALLVIVAYGAETFWLMVPAMRAVDPLFQLGGLPASACVISAGAWVISRLAVVKGSRKAEHASP